MDGKTTINTTERPTQPVFTNRPSDTRGLEIGDQSPQNRPQNAVENGPQVAQLFWHM